MAGQRYREEKTKQTIGHGRNFKLDLKSNGKPLKSGINMI